MTHPAPTLTPPRNATVAARVGFVVFAVAAVVALTGCGGDTSTEATTAPTSTALTSREIPAAPGVVLTGALAAPRTLSSDQLREFPRTTQQDIFTSGAGRQTHTYEGPLLVDVLNAAQPALDPAAKNGLLRLVVVVTGIDGYSVTLAWGEIAPDFAAHPVLLADTEDGKPVSRPRLTAPRDTKGGRYVSDIVEIRVLDAAR